MKIMLVATLAAFALSPIALATGAAAASGHHVTMKKKTANKPKGEPMQNAGSVGDAAATNGKTSNTGNTGNTGSK